VPDQQAPLTDPCHQLTGTDDDLARLAATLTANGSHRSLEHVTWQYRRSLGPTFLASAAEGSDLEGFAALYAVFGSPMWIDGTIQPGLQSLDTVTHSDYRGRGLFTSLASDVYRRAASAGTALVYGFPNGNSVHGFRKLGWTILDPLPMLIRPLSTTFLTARLPRLARLPGLRLPPRRPTGAMRASATTLRAFDTFTSEHDELWERFRRSVTVALDRSSTYLNWRLARPQARYRLLELREGTRLRGWTAVRVDDKHGGRMGYVMEMIAAPGDDVAARLLIRAAIRLAYDDGADAVLAWHFSHSAHHQAFRRAGFLPLPERLRPIELHFGAMPLGVDVADAVTVREHWCLSYVDSDSV